MKFDKATLEIWKKEGVKNVSCTFVEKGCAGTKIQVSTEILPSTEHTFTQDDILIYVRPEEASFFMRSTLTHVGSKWIVKSEDINTRCGCGSSFSLKSLNPIQDKIARMKLAIKQKKEGIHT